ncbi:krab-a domain-containing protein [Pseudoloma neurophilia]|uniref:Krab-a domain-containing protein n=1 Tax=Pseudoloma neurophilia TaxID=146866 RepID=A0A0R0LYX0_9MICR|nr:krab-a domain-containing protein [Pseudoloma neurophilia]
MSDLDDFIESFPDVFKNLDRIVEFCPIEKCPIETETGVVIVKRGSVVPQAEGGQAEEYLKDLLDRKVIRKSTSQWRNPIRFIEKPNGGLRLVSNLMALNDAVKKDSYAIPTMREIYTTTQGCKWFTVIDMKEAYYYIENVECDKCKTAFEFKGQVYEWNGMVMGFKNSPMVMQRTMDRIFEGMIRKNVMVYLDDIIIFDKDLDQHKKNIEKVIRLLSDNNFRVNPAKIQFCQNEAKVLGMVVNGEEKVAMNEKKKEIQENEKPKCIKDLRSFLGSIGWFRGFIKDFANKTESLTEGLKINKKWKWTESMNNEFINLKQEISDMENLYLPDYKKPFVLRTDASNTGIGAVLYQFREKGEERPIEWASKKLTATEARYGISEKKMFAIYWALKNFEYELRGCKFKLETDHKALIEMRKRPQFNNNRINRGIELIQEFDFEIVYVKGVKADQ